VQTSRALSAVLALVSCQGATLECVERTRESSAVREAGYVYGVIDAVMTQIALESVVLRALRSRAGFDASAHKAAHSSMRLALFRMATSASESPQFHDSLRAIAHSCHDRGAVLVWAMLHHLEPAQLASVSEVLLDLADSRSCVPNASYA
jgi:hypothetical protein